MADWASGAFTFEEATHPVERVIVPGRYTMIKGFLKMTASADDTNPTAGVSMGIFNAQFKGGQLYGVNFQSMFMLPTACASYYNGPAFTYNSEQNQIYILSYGGSSKVVSDLESFLVTNYKASVYIPHVSAQATAFRAVGVHVVLYGH